MDWDACRGCRDGVTCACFSPDGRWLAAATYNPVMAPLANEKTPLVKQGSGSSLSWRNILSGMFPLTVSCTEPGPVHGSQGAAVLRVWNTNTWTLHTELVGDAGRIAGMHFLCDPKSSNPVPSSALASKMYHMQVSPTPGRRCEFS